MMLIDPDNVDDKDGDDAMMMIQRLHARDRQTINLAAVTFHSALYTLYFRRFICTQYVYRPTALSSCKLLSVL